MTKKSDISGRLQPLQGMGSQSTAFRAHILDFLYDGVYFVDRDRRITYWNHGAERLTGFQPQETVGSYCFDDILAHVDGNGCQLCKNQCPLTASMEQDRPVEHEIYLRHKLGHRVPVSVRAAPIKNEAGTVIGAVEIFNDVTGKMIRDRRISALEALAFRDPVTCLSNRRYITLKIDQALEEARQFRRHFGLLLLDIDHFKQVNDSWGHPVGDAVLKTISDTLTRALRSEDVVGRWGGDEFMAVLADVDSNSLKSLGDRCRHLIAGSAIPAPGRMIRVTVSIGATLVTPADDAATAIERVDRLMYESKRRRNQSTLG